jgi:Tfp pilus assembly protein PilF
MITRKGIAVLAVLLTGTLIAASMAIAAGSSSKSTRSARQSNYDKAVKAVKSGSYQRAVNLLEKVVARDSGNADAFNYLAFSHRKLGRLDPAMKFYRKALAIDAKHRGANEYIGELFLELGNLAKAKEHLAKLDDICWLGCEEYDDLKAAIGRYEAKKRG